jgi:hypothetical protein
MKATRRGFLGALIAGAAAAAVDPERLLWVPGRKLISVPKPRVVFVEYVELTFDVAIHSKARLIEAEGLNSAIGILGMMRSLDRSERAEAAKRMERPRLIAMSEPAGVDGCWHIDKTRFVNMYDIYTDQFIVRASRLLEFRG